eukprot:Amastigsp_a522664_6.p2 type:complete len:133 gc:universal Amastigsp_a522664_6:578-180(-)
MSSLSHSSREYSPTRSKTQGGIAPRPIESVEPESSISLATSALSAAIDVAISEMRRARSRSSLVAAATRMSGNVSRRGLQLESGVSMNSSESPRFTSSVQRFVSTALALDQRASRARNARITSSEFSDPTLG